MFYLLRSISFFMITVVTFQTLSSEIKPTKNKENKIIIESSKVENSPGSKNNSDNAKLELKQTKEVKDKSKLKEKTDTKKKDKTEDEADKKKSAKKAALTFPIDDSEIRFWIKLRMPEFFYGKNLRFINNNNPTDRVLFFRHTLDLNMEYRYGVVSRGYNVVYAKMTLRNKGIWGDPESIAATTQSQVKVLDSVLGDHSHAIPRHFMWIRELWIQFSLNDLLCLPFCNYHTVTFGAFPFELGRGISLGSAYAVSPSDLGFYAENAIDQYAFGIKFSGDFIKDKLTYDLCGSILDNKAANFNQTNLKLRGQQYGHRNDQARGFGIIDYIISAKLTVRPVVHPLADIKFEPYILYNHNPEQRIEFLGDAKSDLITAGLAGEHECGNWEWGFDTAFNMGGQKVFGWDRNSIQLENRDGFVAETNSRVKQAPPGQNPTQKSPVALNVPENQAIINQSIQSQCQNGQIIGENSLGILINDTNRFTDPYINKYNGKMFVFDFSYYINKPTLKISGAIGYASGDKNPNQDLESPSDSEVDGKYDGFIGLLEVYSGTRVKSAFLLAGSGKIPRVLSFPTQEQMLFNPFPTLVSRFSNIIYVGSSATWRPKLSCRKLNLNPNILAYWQEDPTRLFNRTGDNFNTDKSHMTNVARFADTFLGVEANIFAETEPLEDLRLFAVVAAFFPGQHYKDIKGRPLNRAQQKHLDNLDKTGIINDRVPLLGDDVSFFVNLGLEYRF